MTYDVAIVGGGHNGLVCAAYLAREGKRVVVLEARDLVGGFSTTEEMVLEAPGFMMNPTSIDHVLTNIPPSVVTDLDLARYGLRWIGPDPFYSYLHPDGASIGFWRDHTRTVEEIRRLSRKDALRYDTFVTTMRDFWWTLVPYLQGHPRKVAPATLGQLLRRAVKGRKSLGPAARILLSSPGAVIEEWFEREELRAALACYSVATMSSLDEPGSGVVLSVMAVMHTWGARRPVGGVGAFVEAVAACARRHGADIRTASPVAEVLLSADDSRATGVVTLAGEPIHARQVIAAPPMPPSVASCRRRSRCGCARRPCTTAAWCHPAATATAFTSICPPSPTSWPTAPTGRREGQAPRPLPPDHRGPCPRHAGVHHRRPRHQSPGPRPLLTGPQGEPVPR